MVSKRPGAPSGGSAKKQRVDDYIAEDLEEQRRRAREWAALALGSVNSPKKPAAAKTPKGKIQPPPRRETPPLPQSPSPSPPRARPNSKGESVYERALAKEKALAAAGGGPASSGRKQPPAAPPAAPRTSSPTPPRAGRGRFISYEKAREKELAALAKEEEVDEIEEVYAPPTPKSAASRSSPASGSSAYQRARAREEAGVKPVKSAPLPRQQSPFRGAPKWEGSQLTVWDRAGDYAKMLAAALFFFVVAYLASRMLL